MEFALLALLLLIIVGVAFMRTQERNEEVHDAKSAEVKRREIIEAYKHQMDEALSPLVEDAEALSAEKVRLLQQFSVECSRNIFFDADGVRECIRELSAYEIGTASAE